MKWHLTDVPSTASGYVVTGIIAYISPISEPSPYMGAPPKSRVWENRDDTVWCLSIDYRKPSLGESGILGTYRTHERAKQALSEHVGRPLTEEELSEGTIYGEDETVEIVEQTLGG